MKILKSAVIASVAAQGNLTPVEVVLLAGCDIHGEKPNAYQGRARKLKKPKLS